jgi:hypothetical protein
MSAELDTLKLKRSLFTVEHDNVTGLSSSSLSHNQQRFIFSFGYAE